MNAYDEQQIHEKIAELPDSGRRGHGLTINDKKYVSLYDLMGIAQRKYNQPDLPVVEFEDVVRRAITSDNDLIFTKRFRARTHRGVALYTAQTMIEFDKAQMVVARLGNLLDESYDSQG